MRRPLTLLATVATLIGLVAAPAALATPPQSIEITTTAGFFGSDIPGCESGTWTADFDNLQVAGNPRDDKLILNITVEKTLVCDDDRGEFVIRWRPKVRGVPFPQSGPWTIVDGTLDGKKVHGSGWMIVDLYGAPPPQETFTGKIHIG